MKSFRSLLVMLATAVIVMSCGYTNPNVYSGPSKTIYMTEWKNRTNNLGLDSTIYRSLTRWFQKSSALTTKRSKDGSDLILAGEIISIELPSLSYGSDNTATEVKVKLRVRYVLKDLASNAILMQVGDETWTEEYTVSSSSSTNSDNEQEALDTIVDDLSKKIYQRTIAELPKL